MQKRKPRLQDKPEGTHRGWWRTNFSQVSFSISSKVYSKGQSTPVLLPGKSHGQRSLVGYSPRGHKELDMTERLHFHLVLAWALKMGRNDQVQSPSKWEESFSTGPPPETGVDGKQGQGSPGEYFMNYNTPPIRKGHFCYSLWQKASTTEGAIAEATSLITVSCKFFHHSHSWEWISIKKEGVGSLKELAIWKWRTSGQGKCDIAGAQSRDRWGPGGWTSSQESQLCISTGECDPWQVFMPPGNQLLSLIFYYEEFNI